MKSIFLFQRSLRLDDNLGLIKALSESKTVIPVFCVDPRQATPKNPYFSPYALGFMMESLLDLQEQLRNNNSDLVLLTGEVHKVLPKFCKKENVDKVYMNRDYTPFARQRAEDLQKKVVLEEVDDYLLFDPGSITTSTNTAFRVYTPFLTATSKKKVDKPIKAKHLDRLLSKSSVSKLTKDNGWKLLKKYSKYAPLYRPGGRSEALKRLISLPKTQKHYAKCRDYLTYKTTNLSAYIKFGCISIRETWHGFGKVGGTASKNLRRELIWREFYYHYYIAYPEELEWNKRTVEARLRPNAPDIVKACYKQLNESGFLHNRGRMILANYILKYQKDYWKEGDKMFAKRLVDYDPIVNIGNWRWIEKQPSFKTLKPGTQFKRWDRGCPSNPIDKKILKGSYTNYWLRK